ncbi:MAG: 5-oxoprolinase subunit PxpB [Chromatocurvus sp.]
MKIHTAGENALIVYLGDAPGKEVAARVRALASALPDALGEHLIDMIPSYASLLVVYDALATDHMHVRHCIRGLTLDGDSDDDSGRCVELPVYYSEESGADLKDVASRAGLSVSDVIDLHSSTEYRVYAIGFAPGFAYLGELDERLKTPRLKTPRQRVPRGAVAIADRQTAVYPAVSPGGWNLIGSCPLRMFDPDRDPSMPVSVGDRVRFQPISRDEFLRAGGEL